MHAALRMHMHGTAPRRNRKIIINLLSLNHLYNNSTFQFSMRIGYEKIFVRKDACPFLDVILDRKNSNAEVPGIPEYRNQ